MYINNDVFLDAYIAKSPVDPNGWNGLFARKAFGAGEEIFSLPRPAVTALDTQQLAKTCSNCFFWAAQSVIGDRGSLSAGGEPRTVKKCMGCKTVSYCSKKCQSAHWKREHKRECALFKRLADKGVLPHVGRAVLEVITDPLVCEDRRYPLKELNHHMADFVKAHELFGEEDDRVGEIKTLAKGLHEYSGKKMELTFIELCCGSTLTNSITLYTPTYDPLGIALDPFIASTNHSCDPNAIVVFDGPKISYRTLRPIEKDTEIFIAYVDVNDPKGKRQRDLAHRFFFECKCPRCERGDEPIELDNFDPNRVMAKAAKVPHLDIHDPEDPPFWPKEPKNIEKEKQRLLYDHPLTATANLQGALDAEDPLESISTALAGIELLTYDEHRFPENAYPLHNLRHHVFISLLTLSTRDSFRVAFLHGMKLYLDAQPILYPERFHPVRVVHTWTMVNLARFLSSPDAAEGLPEEPKWDPLMQDEIKKADEILNGRTPKDKENPINLAAVGTAMSSDVAFNINKSHGENSSLAAAVRRMSEEIEQALHQLREAVKTMKLDDAAKNLTAGGIVEEMERLKSRLRPRFIHGTDPTGGMWYR